MDYWDRRLMKSTRELKVVKNALEESDGDQRYAAKKLKKIRKYFKSPLGEVARIDNSIYNVSEQTQEVADGDKGPETQGDESLDRESDRTEL